MSFVSPGTNVPQRVVFNSGTIDFGNERLVDVDNVSLNLEWTTAPLLVLNSIKPQDLVRHSQKVTMTGKVKSWPAEMQEIAFGVSSAGTPNEIDTLDGQPSYQNPVVTFFDRD